jgi:inhibitor of KinA sporulation pathway (predicted exonuclease)
MFLDTSQRFGIGAALGRLGIERAGTAHRGIDDARNIARILRHMSGQQ